MLEKLLKSLEELENMQIKVQKDENANYSYVPFLKMCQQCYFIINYLNRHDLKIKLYNIFKSKLLLINPDLKDDVISVIFHHIVNDTNATTLDIKIINNNVFLTQYYSFKKEVITSIKSRKFKNIFLVSEFEHYEFKDIKLKNELEGNIPYYKKFIAENINEFLKEYYSIAGIDYKSDYFRNLAHQMGTDLVIWLDRTLLDIVKIIQNKQNTHLEMIVKNNDEINIYHIEQTFTNNKPIWHITPVKTNSWSLVSALNDRTNGLTRKINKIKHI